MHTTYGRVGADVREHPVGLFLADEAALGCWKCPIKEEGGDLRPAHTGRVPGRTAHELGHQVLKLAWNSRDDLESDFI